MEAGKTDVSPIKLVVKSFGYLLRYVLTRLYLSKTLPDKYSSLVTQPLTGGSFSSHNLGSRYIEPFNSSTTSSTSLPVILEIYKTSTLP